MLSWQPILWAKLTCNTHLPVRVTFTRAVLSAYDKKGNCYARHRQTNYPTRWTQANQLTDHTHTHPFNGPFSGTTQVSRYQKGKTNLDFTEARDSEWQWHQLGNMQVCTLLQTDNHTSNPTTLFFTGRMPFLPPNQQCQSTEGIIY